MCKVAKYNRLNLRLKIINLEQTTHLECRFFCPAVTNDPHQVALSERKIIAVRHCSARKLPHSRVFLRFLPTWDWVPQPSQPSFPLAISRARTVFIWHVWRPLPIITAEPQQRLRVCGFTFSCSHRAVVNNSQPTSAKINALRLLHTHSHTRWFHHSLLRRGE
jgi:hypothetical protein